MTSPIGILLCAGKGTRMQNERTHKVCYEIAGVPAILRLIRSLKEGGISRFLVVVGNKCEKVMACLDGVEGVAYAYQPEQRGTGDAVRCGLRALSGMGLSGPVFVAMGDKILAPEVVFKLLNAYEDGKTGAVFAVQPMAYNESGGRIAVRGGNVYGIVEQMDLCLHRLAGLHPKTKEELAEAAGRLQLNEKKRGKLMEKAESLLAGTDPEITLCGEKFTPDEIENSGVVNTATYLFDSALLKDALETVKSDNTQGEIYLTDAVNRIAEQREVRAVRFDEKEKILTYSTMDELLRLERYFTPEEQKKTELHPASYWIARLDAWDGELRALFRSIYGEDGEVVAERRQAFRTVLKAYADRYGDRRVLIARAPGRVNLMGRHIEHRGGSINVIAINRETLLVASAREDDLVHLANVDPAFEEREFSILENIRQYDTSNWVDFIESDAITQMVLDHKGDWVNYVKAGVLRLQLENKHQILCGMDMMFYGNIPMAAGLSSSSSIVVATTEAAIGLNGMDLQPQAFINLCGEGEWFVGSRGGAGDHAAMKCGQKGMITHLGFFPFTIGKSVEFPDSVRLIVANSFEQAKKSAGAKDQFNQKVASYEFGLMMVKDKFPQYREKLRYFRDLNPAALGVPPSRIYEILLALPETAKPDELFLLLPEETHEKIRQIFKNHQQPERYDIRSVVLYGIAECERARKCPELFEKKDYRTLGQMMNISHDGDRVSAGGEDYDYSVSDKKLENLIAKLRSEDPEQVEQAQLWRQPGGYACSTPAIDALVDGIKAREGVLGVQLSGAGLGGCIMALVEKDRAEALLSAMKSAYYEPNGLPMGAEIFTPVKGSLTIQ